MNNTLILSVLLLMSSCALGKKVQLQNFVYDLGESSKLSVNSLKRVGKKLEFKLLAISMGAEPVVIKANEIECGAGNKKFKKVIAQSDKNDLIILPKLTYLEFDVNCISDRDVDEDAVPYILFKRIYKLDGTKHGAVVDEDIKINFE